jgi:hypothetical protein
MKGVELYGQVRRAVYVEGLSRREAARRFGIDPRTVPKMLAFSVPPGYRRGQACSPTCEVWRLKLFSTISSLPSNPRSAATSARRKTTDAE